jgi:hypothetical protein
LASTCGAIALVTFSFLCDLLASSDLHSIGRPCGAAGADGWTDG